MGKIKREDWKDVLPPYIQDIYQKLEECPGETLQETFVHHLLTHKGAEPAWVKRLPKNDRRALWLFYALTEPDPMFIVPSIPKAGFGFIVLEDGFTRDVFTAFPQLWRLVDIAQLGKLHDPLNLGEGPAASFSFLFDQSRLFHVIIVRAILRLMALNLGLDERSTTILELAGLTHDTLTPAYGDGAKSIDPVLFDEDLNYPKLLKGKGWEGLQRKYGIDRQLLIDTVQGRGAFGALLDIADKLAYLAVDTDRYLARNRWKKRVGYPLEYWNVDGAAEARTDIFSMWSSVRISGEKVFVQDAKWLGQMLKTRALMFKNLYFNPSARYLERMAALVFIRQLIDEGTITKEQMLVLTDGGLNQIIGNRFGIEVDPTVLNNWEMLPKSEVFSTVAEAEKRQCELFAAGRGVVFIDCHPPAKGCTHLLTKKNGVILPFAEADPVATAEIEAIVAATPTVSLHWVDEPYEKLPRRLRIVADIIRKQRSAQAQAQP